MFLLSIPENSTSQRVPVFIRDSLSPNGAGLTGLVFNSSGLIWTYWREDAGNVAGTAVTLATATLGTFTSGGFVEKDSSLLPGWYELGIPNAALASGAKWVRLQLTGAAQMVLADFVIEITAGSTSSFSYVGSGELTFEGASLTATSVTASSFAYVASGLLTFEGAGITSSTSIAEAAGLIRGTVRHTPFIITFPPLRPGYTRFTKGGSLPSQIALRPMQNKRTLGNPTLLQAALHPFTFFIAGVDRSAYVDVNQTPSGTSQITSGATARFVTQDASGGGWMPAEGDDVQIFEGATPVFFGSITRTVEERLIKTTVPRVTVTCGDATIKMANRVTNAFYSLDLWGSVYFIAPDLVQKHLTDLGITYVPQTSDLFPIGDQLFYCLPVSEALTQMAKAMNADWVVDLNKNLRFLSIATAIANANGFSDASGNWIEVQATRTLALEGNRIFAKSSAQLPQAQTDTFPGNPYGIYVMTYPPRDANLLPVIKVNGVQKIVVSYDDASSGVPYDFYRVGTAVSMNGFHTPLSSSDTVTVTYPSPIPYVAVAEDAVDIAANGLKEVILECGNITSKAVLQEIADAALARLKARATQLMIATAGNVQGTALPAANRDWQPGQTVSVNFTASAGATPVVDTFLVDTVSWTIRDNVLRFQTLTLVNAQYQRTANPAKWMADLIANLRTIALPVTQVMTLLASTDLGTGFVLNVNQQINLDSSKGALTVTLPLPADLYGKEITFKKISSDTNVITIAAPAGRTIDGFTSQTLTIQNDFLVLAGNQWQ